jgi:hypothetical protein
MSRLWVMAVPLATCGLAVSADSPREPIGMVPPSAGVVTFTDLTVDKGTITVEGTTAERKDWTPGELRVYASLQDAGKTGAVVLESPAADRAAGAKEWKATVSDVPNGTYTVWAIYRAETKGDYQPVASALKRDVVVNRSAAPAIDLAAHVTYTDRPLRQGGGTRIAVDGTAAIQDRTTWRLAPTRDRIGPVTVFVIPARGGFVQQWFTDASLGPGDEHWRADFFISDSQLDYYVATIVTLEPRPNARKPNARSQRITTGWVASLSDKPRASLPADRDHAVVVARP